MDNRGIAGQPRPRLRLTPDREQVEYFGLSEREMFDSIGAVMGGQTVGYAQRGGGRTPLEISVRLPQADRTWSERLASTPVAASSGGRLVQLGEVVRASREARVPIRTIGRTIGLAGGWAKARGSLRDPSGGHRADASGLLQERRCARNRP